MSTIVVDTTHSPHARQRPVPITAVTLTDEFWSPRLRINRQVTLPAQYRLLQETGRLDNLRRASGKKQTNFTGYFFNDTDVYKWLEAVAWALATEPDPALEQMADSAIVEIADAQRPDGYLNSFYALDKANERWTNLRDMHELYCAGHLFQAAIAHARATGSDRMLNIARRFADHIYATFGPESEGKRPGVCGHPEVEMALVELARQTGESRYLEQARYFIDARGHHLIGGKEYHQDHVPLREMDRMVGHAVRAAYLNAGAADLYAETGDAALRAALERMWRNLTQRQMYVTGGIGSRYEGEALGADYELPNTRAYTETCAAIALVMWAWRMLVLDGDASYADVMETALYNGVLSGISLDGLSYFYENPLADDGQHRRTPWHECACCPPNIARMLASLPGYYYSTDEEGIYVHLYAEGSARIALPDGRTIGVTQRTRYPWLGQVSLELDAESDLSLFLRIPGWCEAPTTLEINGTPYPTQLTPGSYVAIWRTWHKGDTVQLSLPMPVRRVQAHPYALENNGRVALMRGPLVYCVEGADNLGLDLRDLVLPSNAEINTSFLSDLLGGVVTLSFDGQLASPDAEWTGRLYRTAHPTLAPMTNHIRVTAIPYYAWANRQPGPTQVWLRHSA